MATYYITEQQHKVPTSTLWPCTSTRTIAWHMSLFTTLKATCISSNTLIITTKVKTVQHKNFKNTQHIIARASNVLQKFNNLRKLLHLMDSHKPQCCEMSRMFRQSVYIWLEWAQPSGTWTGQPGCLWCHCIDTDSKAAVSTVDVVVHLTEI